VNLFSRKALTQWLDTIINIIKWNTIITRTSQYAIFSIPLATEWTLIIHKNWQQHLTDDYDPKDNLVRVRVEPQQADHMERLQYFIEVNGKSGKIIMAWEKIRVHSQGQTGSTNKHKSMFNRKILIAVATVLTALADHGNALGQSQQSLDSLWRPQVHFSAARNWLNDPNGMVFHQGIYHLFFQHHPNSPKWGPMHWGHATSTDLVHWIEQPIKLFPDSLGYIFSGSAVVDRDNTSGFGTKDNPPLVAIFTHHDPARENTSSTFQNQSLAFSLDNGRTWTKYTGNPVLKNPGITDFRDPKVMWYEARKCWIMTLATKDCVTFYASPNLRDWTMESSFGKDRGAQGGVWECPDLFPLQLAGKTYWVLLVSLNPGGPNGGSATQYFIGDFDGRQFRAIHEDARWLDYGPDNYAGVTWSNTADRKLFMGWMSNWDYANDLPSSQWRNVMTIARELQLVQVRDTMRVASLPVKEMNAYSLARIQRKDFSISAGRAFSTTLPGEGKAWELDLQTESKTHFHIRLLNDAGEEIMIGYNLETNAYFIDRGLSGKVAKARLFSRKIEAPRYAQDKTIRLKVIIDASSVELFADGGLSVLSAVFFPTKKMNRLVIGSQENMRVRQLLLNALKPDSR
jgi:fructan beta-fructosidase